METLVFIFLTSYISLLAMASNNEKCISTPEYSVYIANILPPNSVPLIAQVHLRTSTLEIIPSPYFRILIGAFAIVLRKIHHSSVIFGGVRRKLSSMFSLQILEISATKILVTGKRVLKVFFSMEFTLRIHKH